MKFVEEMPNSEYHAAKGLSKTKLDLIDKDPALIEWYGKCPQDEEKIKTFDFGDAVHAICLEPDRLKSEFIVMPAFNLRTNVGKEEKAAFDKEHTDKKILTSDEYKKLNLMFESVMAHPEARALIEADGVCEGSYFWQDEQTGLDCKCRPDKQIGSLLIDVKSTPDIEKFCYSVDDYRYYVQDPWYCDGVERFGYDNTRMVFLAVQKNISAGRYPVSVVRLPDEAIEYGRVMYRRNMESYIEFKEHGKACVNELPMHFRFMERAMEATTEVFI